MRRFLLLTSLSCFAVNGFAAFKGVYGEDNRLDITDSSRVIQELSGSVAAKISSRFIHTSRGQIHLSGPKLEERENLCNGERFSKELSVASCSGFLIGEDTLLTAGHCVINDRDCATSNWVFGFNNGRHDGNGITLPYNSFYRCKKIVSREFKKDGIDYAIIKLDRKVTDREPLKLADGRDIFVGEELFVIGHPSGLPAKVAGNAYVRNISKNRFEASLDTFVNNSGSPVFNSDTLEVEGVLVSGGTDYLADVSGTCNRVKICKMTGCLGEGVVRVSSIFLKKY